MAKRLNKKGAVAIEFALIAPLLLFMLFGIMEFGLTLAIDSTLNNALRNVGRQAAVTPYNTADQVKDGMKYYMQNFYKDDVKVIMCAYPNIESLRLSGLKTNPRMLFDAPPGYNAVNGGCVTGGASIAAPGQINAILVFAAEYNWGGISGFYEGIIPKKLYSVTILRSEYWQ